MSDIISCSKLTKLLLGLCVSNTIAEIEQSDYFRHDKMTLLLGNSRPDVGMQCFTDAKNGEPQNIKRSSTGMEKSNAWRWTIHKVPFLIIINSHFSIKNNENYLLLLIFYTIFYYKSSLIGNFSTKNKCLYIHYETYNYDY